jgi:hypothetical protein
MAAATFWAVAQSKSIPAGVALPPDDVVASLRASGAFSVPPDGVTGDAATVTLRFSRSAFPFRGDLPYSTAGTLTYTFASRVWRVQETPCA